MQATGLLTYSILLGLSKGANQLDDCASLQNKHEPISSQRYGPFVV